MYRSKDLTSRLSISPATLRIWSSEFASSLSPAAQASTTESGKSTWRQYTPEDLSVLTRVKGYLAQNKTYEETRALLLEQPEEPIDIPQSSNGSAPMIVENTHPIIQAFEQALIAKDQVISSKEDTIQALQTVILGKDELIKTLQSQPSPTPATVTPRFKWNFLNRLLSEGQAATS